MNYKLTITNKDTNEEYKFLFKDLSEAEKFMSDFMRHNDNAWQDVMATSEVIKQAYSTTYDEADQSLEIKLTKN